MSKQKNCQTVKSRRKGKFKMADEELNEDDADSYSVCSDDMDRNTTTTPETPTLDDYLVKILKESQVSQTAEDGENRLHIAKTVTGRILSTAYHMNSLCRKYLMGKGGKIADVADFRCLDGDVFQCLVLLQRPVRPDTFQLCFKLPNDLPSHRIPVRISDSLMTVDKMQVTREWTHCVDSNGVLRPDLVLKWFNSGLKGAIALLKEIKPSEENKIDGVTIRGLSSWVDKDGTLSVNIKWVTKDQEVQARVNIVPCIPMTDIPRQIRILSPTPSCRPYFDSHADFMQTINDSLESGEALFFLEARNHNEPKANGCSSSHVHSWGVNMLKVEELAMQFIGEMNGQHHLRDVLTVIDIINHAHVICIHPISNRLLVNVIFHQHRQYLGKVEKREGWFLKTIEKLASVFSSTECRSFFQRKCNLLQTIDKKLSKFTGTELKRMLQAINDNPEAILRYAGMSEETTEDEQNEKNYQEGNDNPAANGTSGSGDETEKGTFRADGETVQLTKTDEKEAMYGLKHSKGSKNRKK